MRLSLAIFTIFWVCCLHLTSSVRGSADFSLPIVGRLLDVDTVYFFANSSVVVRVQNVPKFLLGLGICVRLTPLHRTSDNPPVGSCSTTSMVHHMYTKAIGDIRVDVGMEHGVDSGYVLVNERPIVVHSLVPNDVMSTALIITTIIFMIVIVGGLGFLSPSFIHPMVFWPEKETPSAKSSIPSVLGRMRTTASEVFKSRYQQQQQHQQRNGAYMLLGGGRTGGGGGNVGWKPKEQTTPRWKQLR